MILKGPIDKLDYINFIMFILLSIIGLIIKPIIDKCLIMLLDNKV